MPEEELANRQMSRFTYISSLAGSSLKRSPDGKCGQIITVNLTTDYDAALFLKALHDKISTGDLVRLPKMEKANFSQEDRAEFILASFPKIGEVRAKQLLRRYGSLFETLNVLATLDVEVKGIGNEGVKVIKEILNHKYGE
jgi:ERCC4-type nuclease